MLNIRRAVGKDNPRILKILKDLDLYYEDLVLKDFWVAERENSIIGIVQLKDHSNLVFLGSLGVEKEEQGKGIAARLLDIAGKNTKKPIFLYTVIPDFFKKHGFAAADPLPGLPSKERYECEACFPEKCVTMVKYPDAA